MTAFIGSPEAPGAFRSFFMPKISLNKNSIKVLTGSESGIILNIHSMNKYSKKRG